jgi:hypothetical protein
MGLLVQGCGSYDIQVLSSWPAATTIVGGRSPETVLNSDLQLAAGAYGTETIPAAVHRADRVGVDRTERPPIWRRNFNKAGEMARRGGRDQ